MEQESLRWVSGASHGCPFGVLIRERLWWTSDKGWGQLPPVLGLGPLERGNKVKQAPPLVLGLGTLEKGHNASRGQPPPVLSLVLLGKDWNARRYWLLPVLSLGALGKGWDASRGQLPLYWTWGCLGKTVMQAMGDHHLWEGLELLRKGLSMVSWVEQGRNLSDSRVNGDWQIGSCLYCTSLVEEEHNKKNKEQRCLPVLPSPESVPIILCPSSPHPKISLFNSSWVWPMCFRNCCLCCWSLEQVSLCTNPLRIVFRSPFTLFGCNPSWSTKSDIIETPLLGTDALGQGVWLGLRLLVPQGVHSAQISFMFMGHHTVGMGPDQTASLFPLPVSTWLLYILSYRNSVQLVFGWFSGVVVLDLVIILMCLWKEAIQNLLHCVDLTSSFTRTFLREHVLFIFVCVWFLAPRMVLCGCYLV